MMSVGETLRQQRLKRNVQLQDVSEQLKISSRMLEAIEADEFDKLPGGVFAKSFVRQYAGVLGLDEEEVATQFEQAAGSPELTHLAELRRPSPAPGLPRIAERHFSSSRPRNILSSLAAVVVVMLVCSAVYGWWQRSRQLAAMRQQAPPVTAARRAAPPASQAPPPRPQAQPQPHVTTAAATAKPPSAVAAAATPTATLPPPAVGAVPASSASTTAAPPPSQPGVPQPLAPDAGPAANEAVHVELVVAEPVWVRVERDGHLVYEGVLQPKEIRTVAASSEVTLKLGNAAGLTILLNGKPIPSPGGEGEVRTIQLTSGGFQIVPPAAPAAPAPAPAPAPRAPALLEPL